MYIKGKCGSNKKMFAKFAGDNAPEKYMLEKLKESEDFARYVDDSDEFVSFIDCEISLSDHHGLFRVVDGLVLFFGGEFDEVRNFIKKEIAYNG